MKYDAIIVGGGIAGLTAAAYVARAGQKILLVERQEKVGGLIQTFSRNGVYFDGGLRSIENSGIVQPMLRQLGIEIDFLPSPVSIGIAESVLKLKDKSSIVEYEALLKYHFPENKEDVNRIIAEIRKIMGYMDVLYGIDNPVFLNMTADKKYLLKVILPWMFKFVATIRRINKLKLPVNEHLKKLTNNQALIDNIAQHFFQETPTSFALSYFSLYLDYYYPRGGTAVLIDKLEKYIISHGGEIKTSTPIVSLQPEQKYLLDNSGNRFEYNQLIWAGDMKLLYNCIPLEELTNKKLVLKITEKRTQLKNLKGGDSVFSVYLTVNEQKEYFGNIHTGHFFYTPSKVGLSKVNNKGIEAFLSSKQIDKSEFKTAVKEYIVEYLDLNTFEISVPVLRDDTLAPAGQCGVIVSILFDYQLAKEIDKQGWSAEIKTFIEENIIRVLDESIYPKITSKISHQFSSSPLTIEKLTGNTDGGITGWAFTNPIMPSENRMLSVAKSVETILPSIYQAGQWVYSPAGMPIAILTGKLASDKVLKNS